MYADENGQALPYDTWNDGTTTLTWDVFLNAYLGGHLTVEAEAGRTFVSIANSLKVLQCPSDRMLRVSTAAARTYRMPRTGTQQLGVGKFSGSATPPASVRLNQVDEPVQTILLAEWGGLANAQGYYNNVQGAQGTPLNSPDDQTLDAKNLSLHDGLFNYLFCDGHVQFLKPELTVGTGSTAVPKGMWTVAPGD